MIPRETLATGGRLRQGHLWELVRRLARTAGIGAWEQLSPHCLRHSSITFALDAGASLHDVQDYAGHKARKTSSAPSVWCSMPWCSGTARRWQLGHGLLLDAGLGRS